jgi:hypothetical protein
VSEPINDFNDAKIDKRRRSFPISGFNSTASKRNASTPTEGTVAAAASGPIELDSCCLWLTLGAPAAPAIIAFNRWEHCDRKNVGHKRRFQGLGSVFRNCVVGVCIRCTGPPCSMREVFLFNDAVGEQSAPKIRGMEIRNL